MPAHSPETSDQPREQPPGVWDPPPVRRGSEIQEQAPPAVEETPDSETVESEILGPRISKRRAWYVIVGLVLFATGLFVVLISWGLQAYFHNEERLFTDASKLYTQRSFGAAREKYDYLAKHFPSSEHAPEYSFQADWCGVCSTVSDPGTPLPTAVDQLGTFVQDHKNDPLMAEVSHDAGQHLIGLANTLAARNANPTDEKPLAVVKRIGEVQRKLLNISKSALKEDENGQIKAALDKVRRAVDLATKRRNVLAQIHQIGKETPMDAIKRSHTLLAQWERELPGIGNEAAPALAELEKAHFKSVIYKKAEDNLAAPSDSPLEKKNELWFAPLVHTGAAGGGSANEPIVLALCRGVLYALKQSNGDLKWAKHVGIDTTVLPQRVPASDISPELILVLSADTNTLSALNVEGNPMWQYHVGQPVLGRPIILEHRAYLADYSGLVHEIELSRGQLLGRWSLGQPLTCGGAHEEGTSRLYFPADDSCVYVLDVNPKEHRCVTILYDGHPSGSLRSEPVVIPPEGGNAPGYLILNQASGLDAMSLRVFELPLQDRHAPPLTLRPQARLDGWTWFKPKEDYEKLAILSDAGTLGLFGIRQLGNKDTPLFPLLQKGELDLSSVLQPAAGALRGPEQARERGRAMVVHMRSDDLWVLAYGRFQQLHLHQDWRKGPQAVTRWKAPLVLGSPLHEPQRIEDRSGHSTFYLVTQALEQQTCLATAVDDDGKVLWQRQLGLVCQNEPLALTPPQGGPPMLVMLDQGGGLFELDPQQPPDNLGSVRRALAPALAENPLAPPRLLQAADGHSAYEIAAPGNGEWLIVRHIQWATGKRALEANECKAPLLEPTGPLIPAGVPTVTGSRVWIPMNDGSVRELSLTDNQPTLRMGPTWSDSQTPAIAPCVLALGGDRFLTTNGNRTLSVFEWPLNKQAIYERLPRGGKQLKPLEHLMAFPPVLLPAGADRPARIVVADSTDELRLFTVAQDGALQPGLTWKLEGKLTARPFVQPAPGGGWRIGCVLDRRRLVWIDPTKAEPLWKEPYTTGGPAIIGQPQRIEDMLVVALQSGRYVGIDPKTGRPKGPGYTLHTSAAPAATPTAFGPARMFAPLSDGTALLLSVELLR